MNGPIKLKIIAAEFHKKIADDMIASALNEAKKLGIKTEITRVPGCFEIPLVTEATICRDDISGIIALGFIERGKTMHGEIMGHVVFRALMDLQFEFRKPVGFGIIGPGATLKQAQERKDSAARAAIRAAVTVIHEVRSH